MPEGGAVVPMIIPRGVVRAVLAQLARMAPDAPVDLAQEDLRGAFAARGWTLRFKAIDDTFPDYLKEVPKEGEGVPITVAEPRRLAQALRTVTALGSTRSQPVKLSNGTGNTLRLSCRADGGDGEAELAVAEDVAAWSSNQPHPETGFQARYLLDICQAFPRGFTLRVSDVTVSGTSAGACRIEAAEGFGAIMPMRV